MWPLPGRVWKKGCGVKSIEHGKWHYRDAEKTLSPVYLTKSTLSSNVITKKLCCHQISPIFNLENLLWISRENWIVKSQSHFGFHFQFGEKLLLFLTVGWGSELKKWIWWKKTNQQVYWFMVAVGELPLTCYIVIFSVGLLVDRLKNVKNKRKNGRYSLCPTMFSVLSTCGQGVNYIYHHDYHWTQSLW